jgi:Flp pilus assembly protein TadG
MWRTQRRGFAVRRRIDPRREDGVAMTEFAIILPVFMLLVVGMLVFGRLLYYWIETNHVANETARWVVVDRNPYSGQTLQQSAKQRATEEFDDNVSVCIDFPGKTRATVEPGDPVRVRVQVPVSFVKFFGWGVTIKGSSTMRLERIADNVDPIANPAQDIPVANGGGCS